MSTSFPFPAAPNRSLMAIGLLLGIAVSGQAHAQTDGTDEVGDVRARTAIQATLRESQAKGLPIDALLRKVREGVSKQASPAQIQAAVQSMAARLEASHNALKPTVSVEELSAGEGALQMGVPAGALRDLRRISPDRPLTVPLGVLTELVAQQVPVPTATKRLRELMERGANNTQLVALGEKVESDVAAGIAPNAALDLRAKGVMSLLTNPLGTAGTGILPNPPRPPIRPK